MILWRQVQRKNFNRIEALIDFLQLDGEKRKQVLQFPRFTLNLPIRLAEKIEKNNLDDPLFRQFVPLKEEKIITAGFCQDPVGDISSQKTPKLLHKYQGRALLLCTSSCAMHCRFCFRQHFPYESEHNHFAPEVQAIAHDATLEEIILSGGDPLSLSDSILERLLSDLSTIPHIKRIRFHSRFPIGIPERIDDSFLKILDATKIQKLFVVHVNHPRELDSDVLTSLKKIQRLGVPILSQSVLLRGVNDDFPTLKTLFETLVNHGILPYYLHQFDRVQGLAHFEVEEAMGSQLIFQLRSSLPGYAIPQYVREVPRQISKTPITPIENP